MSVPQAPHTVPFVCTRCLGIEDFTAYAMCLPRYPFLGHHQAHPVLMPGAREPGQQMRPGPSPGADLVALFCTVPSLCSGAPDAGDLGSVRVQGWTLGSGEELSPSSSSLFPGLIPATTDKTKLSGQAALSVWASVTAPLYFLGQSLCETGTQEAALSSDTAVCFPMDYRRG